MRLVDLTGQRFGSLTVIAKAGVTTGRYKRTIWRCVCDCGNEVTILSANVRTTRFCSERCTERWSTHAGYRAAHQRIVTHRGKASVHLCECGRRAQEWAYDHGRGERQVSPTGSPYSLDPSDYKPLCAPCHRTLDLAHARAVA